MFSGEREAGRRERKREDENLYKHTYFMRPHSFQSSECYSGKANVVFCRRYFREPKIQLNKRN